MSEFYSCNPYTGERWASYPAFDLLQLDTTLQTATQAQQNWQQQTPDTRAQLLRTLAQELRSNAASLAELASREMGKTLKSAVAEVEKCAAVCDYYAEHGPALIQDQPVHVDDDARRLICYQPLGLVLAIMPWNFPFWQVFRFLAPALMAGNGAVLKHASNVPGCAQAIADTCAKAGLPTGVFSNLRVSSADASQLIAHPLIAAVTFTGSTQAGRKIAGLAGQHLKKTVLELGGSDAYLILDDADLELAVEKCVTSRLLNNGQSCIAAKRFIVHNSLYGDFVATMAAAMNRQRVGDPLLDDTDVGPQAREDLCQQLSAQVEESLRLGAVLIAGGQSEGATYWPTVLGEVRPGMPAFDDELFGPVAAVIRARDDDDAVQLANQSIYGLGAAVFSRTEERALAVAARLQAGACAVNDFVKSEPAMPFGGIKASGYGRELGAIGLREFTNIKALVIR